MSPLCFEGGKKISLISSADLQCGAIGLGDSVVLGILQRLSPATLGDRDSKMQVPSGAGQVAP
jgi:hypothetical protein